MQDKMGEAKASGNLGNTMKVLGRYDESLLCCKRHLSVSRELGDKVGTETRADSRPTGRLEFCPGLSGNWEPIGSWCGRSMEVTEVVQIYGMVFRTWRVHSQ